MSLQVWLPLNGSLENQGLDGTVTLSQNTGATIDNDGKIGKCYSFDASNDWIQYNIDKTKYGNKPISYSYWFKCDQNDAGGAILDLAADLVAGYTYSSNGIKFTYWRCWSNSGTRTGDSGTTPNFYNANIWHHIAVIFNANINQIYVDGILALTEDKSSKYTTYWTPLLGTSYNKFSIGKSAGDSNWIGGKVNDVRIYDHALSAKEVEEIAKGLVLHYKLDSIGNRSGNPNLGNTSANYSNQIMENVYTASGWGGDTGTITYYASGGYNNLPYKVYHKTATGTGGIYRKTADDIIIEEGKTYTFSCWIKSDRNFTESAYGFNINRGSGNYYINYGTSLALTTDWQFFQKTFTATADQAGNYGEMSIIYDDNVADYYVYYSGFKIEEGSDATEWTDPRDNTQSIIYDTSGYGNNGIINTTLQLSNNTVRYNASTLFNGISSSITIPYKAVNPDGIFTMNLWFYKDALGSENYETLFGGPSGFEMDTRAGSSTTLSLYMASTRGGNVFSPFSLSTWYMVTMIRDGVNEKYYINGELKKTIEAKSMPNGTYFIGAWSNASGQNYYGNISDFRLYCTPLTDEQILELYNTSATIDNKGNIYARKFIEED